jgi:hypothetical protein
MTLVFPWSGDVHVAILEIVNTFDQELAEKELTQTKDAGGIELFFGVYVAPQHLQTAKALAISKYGLEAVINFWEGKDAEILTGTD